MAKITKSEQAVMPDISRLIEPSLIAKLSQDELSDRVHHARALLRKSAVQADPTLKRGYAQLAGAVLRSNEPRDEVEKHYNDLMVKAQLTASTVIAGQLRDSAHQYLDAHPIAPRRQQAVRAQLAKAAADGQLGVWDKDGNLLGTVDPTKVTPLVSAPGGAQPAAKGQAPEDDDPAVGQAIAATRPLGTPKEPASAETPAAMGEPDEIAKSVPPRYNVMVQRRGPR
jgi:hypothetical protein